MRFTDEAEVVALANDSLVGLAGYFYSKDLSRVWRRRSHGSRYRWRQRRHYLNRSRALWRHQRVGPGYLKARHWERYLETKYILMGVFDTHLTKREKNFQDNEIERHLAVRSRLYLTPEYSGALPCQIPFHSVCILLIRGANVRNSPTQHSTWLNSIRNHGINFAS